MSNQVNACFRTSTTNFKAVYGSKWLIIEVVVGRGILNATGPPEST